MSADSAIAESRSLPARLFQWLRLLRLPTVFTAVSNILSGYFVSTRERSLPALAASPELWILLISGAGLYLGGMVLNDVFDAELDARERPERPIPSGRISRAAAAVFGSLLLVTGVAAAGAADVTSATGSSSTRIACFLAVAIVLYDAVLKSTVLGPLGMGTCRFLNIMLGASCAGGTAAVWSPPQLIMATALGVYVFGVTWFARNEAGDSSRSTLLAGLSIALAGIGINAWLALKDFAVRSPAAGAAIALALIAANVSFRCVRAIQSNQPVILQKTVGFMLLNIIFMDAAMTFCVTGSARLAALIVILVVPATLMKRVLPLS